MSELFLWMQRTIALCWPHSERESPGQGLLSLYARLALGSLPASFLFTYLIFVLFAAQSVPNDELLHWACDQQEENQC